MRVPPLLAILLGAGIAAGLGVAGGLRYGETFAAAHEDELAAAIAAVGGDPVRARLVSPFGGTTRHPVLEGGEALPDAKRSEIAHAVAAVPGIGGVFWSDGTMTAQVDAPRFTPLHCEEDVDGLLRSRSIRFEEGSAALAGGSSLLLNEVAQALRPCLGSIIAITGHTDDTGPEPGNLALSRDRARRVREALVARGIPRDGLRALGVGSSEPVEGLAPSDPANRRIEFSVIRTEPIDPTPIDTPGAR